MNGVAQRQGRRKTTSTPTPPGVIVLREDFFRGDTAHKVDRDKGIVYGVKVIGLTSPNSHGMAGADGTVYTPEALRLAAPLYEGIQVYKNHPPRSNPNQERPIEAKIGWLENVRVTESGLYADLHLLTSDDQAAKIMEAAEKHPAAFGLSHNASAGRSEVKNGRFVIYELADVRSVDLVSEAATVRSLFESRRTMEKIPVRKVFESWLPKVDEAKRAALKKLMEDDYGSAPVMDAPMDAPAEDASPEDALWQGVKSALMAILDSDMSADEKAAKVKEFLKAHEKLTAEPEPEEPVAEGDDEEDKDEKDKKKMEESKRLKALEAEVTVLREEREQNGLREWIREEATKRKLPLDKTLVEDCLKVKDKPLISRLLERLQGVAAAAKAKSGMARSSSPGTPVKSTADDYAKFKQAVLN